MVSDGLCGGGATGGKEMSPDGRGSAEFRHLFLMGQKHIMASPHSICPKAVTRQCDRLLGATEGFCREKQLPHDAHCSDVLYFVSYLNLKVTRTGGWASSGRPLTPRPAHFGRPSPITALESQQVRPLCGGLHLSGMADNQPAKITAAATGLLPW